jgi:catechol 2,3-dioxygenase-like lactoylglutathione lyase family enzyme
MPITELNHYMIVSQDLERSKTFYCNVLGMEIADRPDFGFPGYWLKVGNEVCVHLASQNADENRDRYLLKKHPTGTNGSGSIDHIAFLAQNPKAMYKRIHRHGVENQFRSLPGAKPFQIFLKDPDDVTVELNFFGELIEEKEWLSWE